MDERLRQLQQQAELGDLEAQVRLVNQLRLINRLPEKLAIIIDLIDPIYQYFYYSILNFLEENGIPYQLRPERTCNCENMACADLGDHRIDKNLEYASRCEKCNWPLEEPEPPQYRQLNKVCINRNCILYQQTQYTVGQCSRIAWRAYARLVGGYCDICSQRLPKNYHENCNCPQCGTGIGPFILIRSKLLSDDLGQLENNYREVFQDYRTVTQPFTQELNYPDLLQRSENHPTILQYYQEERGDTRFLNSFGNSLIEILPNGLFRLRMIEHLNERAINIFTFPRDMEFCQHIEKQQIKSIVRFKPRLVFCSYSKEQQKFIDACFLLKTHYLGLDLNISELTNHLSNTRNRPPDAVIVANQIKNAMDILYLGYSLIFDRDQFLNIDPNEIRFSLTATLVGREQPPSFIETRYPVIIEVDRFARYDQARFGLANREDPPHQIFLILNFNSRDPWGASPQMILENLARESES